MEWNIQARAHVCEACSKSFRDKEPYHTLLFDEKADFHRSDICEACWEKQYSEGAKDRKGFVSYWQGIYEVPTPPEEPIKKETAESLLRKLIEMNDPRYIPAAFILAVMLERKRLLKVKEEIVRDGQRVFIYEQPRTGDVFTVTDPNLQLTQLEAVQRDVATLLEEGFNPGGNAPGTETQATPGAEAAAATDSATPAVSTEPVENPEAQPPRPT